MPDDVSCFPPSLADRYRPLRPIGTGGMAKVWAACRATDGTEVAVKVMGAELVGDPEFRQRFAIEAAVAAKSKHSGLVRIFEFGEADGAPYLFMELFHGSSLRRRLRRGPLDAAAALDVVGQLADCLGSLHELGVVHRDVKPDNVMLEPDGRVRLLDLGVARFVEGGGPTRTGMVLGSVWYLAPEVVRGEPATPAADVYALGVTLAECLAAEPLFSAWQGREGLFLSRRSDGDFVVSSGIRCEARIERVLRRLLAPQQALRPADGAAAADVFRQAIADSDQSLDETTMVSVHVTVDRAVRPRSRRLGCVALFLGMLALLIALAVHRPSSLVTVDERPPVDGMVAVEADVRALVDGLRGTTRPMMTEALLDERSKEFLRTLDRALTVETDWTTEPSELVRLEVYKEAREVIDRLRTFEDVLIDRRQDAASRSTSLLALVEQLQTVNRPQLLRLAESYDELWQRRRRSRRHLALELVRCRLLSATKSPSSMAARAEELARTLPADLPCRRHWLAACLAERAYGWGTLDDYERVMAVAAAAAELEDDWPLPADDDPYGHRWLVDVQIDRLHVVLRRWRSRTIPRESVFAEFLTVRNRYSDAERRDRVNSWIRAENELRDEALARGLLQ